MNIIFRTRKTDYNLTLQTDFASNCVINTNKFRLNSLRYFASKVLKFSKYSKEKLDIRSLKKPVLLPVEGLYK